MVFTQSQIQDVQAVVDRALKTLREDKELISSIADAVAAIVETKLEKTFTDINNSVKELQSKVSSLEIQNEQLIKDNANLNTALEDLQQYSRRNNIRIFGIEQATEEVTDDVVLKLFQEKLGVTLNQNAIDRSHRIGRSDRKHIIVKFVNYHDRKLILSSKKKLKGSGIAITEDLTKSRLRIFTLAKEKFKKENVWTNDGKIWVKTTTGIEGITTEDEVRKLLN